MKLLLSLLLFNLVFAGQVFASDVQTNKVGINVLSPEADISDAAKLVNTNGDWGWVVLTIRNNERDIDRWQVIFDALNKNHLIPIVRIATNIDEYGKWQRPGEKEAYEWADFLNKLHWPVKNRYVQVYNEVNRSAEWGGNVDPADYTKELNKTIDVLNDKNEDFFILNAPLDLALGTSAGSLEAATYFSQMEAAVPGIFKKLDGWASHSYPNPEFSASPAKSGRTGIDGYKWELLQIDSYLEGKELPVFITETGWKREYLTEENISSYYRFAFENIWNQADVLMVAPFVLNYHDGLFDVFSFKKDSAGSFYKYFDTVRDLEKVEGNPERKNIGGLTSLKYPKLVIKESPNRLNFTLKNEGNHIWDTEKINTVFNAANFEILEVKKPQKEIYPGDSFDVTVSFKSKDEGLHRVKVRVEDFGSVIGEQEIEIDSKTYLSLVYNLFQSVL